MRLLGLFMFLSLSILSACKTGKPKPVAAEYTFSVSVREKYCKSARLNPVLVKESEREKPYATQRLFLVKKGSTDTLNFLTTVNGEFSGKLEEGTYQVFFPEKFERVKLVNNQACRDWLDVPDTTLVLSPGLTSVRLNLYRPCSPCNPIRN